MKKLIRLFTWLLQLAILLLLVLFMKDNMQVATLNIFNVYIFTLPLIILLLITLTIGMLFGGLISLFYKFKSKNQKVAIN